VDKYIAARRRGEDSEGRNGESQSTSSLESGAWVTLGAGTFFSSMSQRSDAIRRLSKSRCNVLLVIRPDEVAPCYPKHMSLRGSSVDDTLFPLGALFRITRIQRTVSSELIPEVSKSSSSNSRWPVMIIELLAVSHHTEVLELLERRGDLGAGELESRLEAWISEAPSSEEQASWRALGAKV